MNKIEYMQLVICRDLENIKDTQRLIKDKNLELINELIDAGNDIDVCEEEFGSDDERTIKSYMDYEIIRKPITELESQLLDFKKDFINHYESFLEETNQNIDLNPIKTNLVKLDETIEAIKTILIPVAEEAGFNI